MAIDIGAPAINRTYDGGQGLTVMVKDNPANASGRITSIEVWAYESYTNAKVAIFKQVSADTFTARSSQAIGAIPAGSRQTIPVDLDVEVGDFIGMYGDGSVRMDVGGEGWWFLTGDYTSCVDQEFTTQAERILSLYGTGEEAPGWTGKICGVTNPAKIMGVEVANIAKVKGVA